MQRTQHNPPPPFSSSSTSDAQSKRKPFLSSSMTEKQSTMPCNEKIMLLCALHSIYKYTVYLESDAAPQPTRHIHPSPTQDNTQHSTAHKTTCTRRQQAQARTQWLQKAASTARATTPTANKAKRSKPHRPPLCLSACWALTL